ncbi:unnamed protein product [Staurois parvus]|uniref:Uncharacterized protein n=1 Tax=Staurois parvus TaxID=386267 RepID=A0ABN9BWS8_9NEOB|nr:unnamed protein product [Staurois parvus]
MARIDVPSWRSWTAFATSVGSRYHLMLPGLGTRGGLTTHGAPGQ